MAVWSKSAHDQKAAVAVLRSAGARVLYDNDKVERTQQSEDYLSTLIGIDFFGSVKSVSLDVTGEGATKDLILTALSKLTHLEDLTVSHIALADRDLELLHTIPRLRRLRLFSGTNITDVGCDHLRKCVNLDELCLEGASLTEIGTTHLSQIRLKWLNLIDCDLDNRALVPLGSMTTLTSLSVRGSYRISDAGLTPLGELKKLVFLDLHPIAIGDCGVTQIGRLYRLKRVAVGPGTPALRLAELKIALPMCDFGIGG